MSFGLVVLVLWLPTALLVGHYPTPSDWVTCSANCPHNAFMVVSHEPGVVASVVLPVRELLVVLLFLAVLARLVQRIVSASRIRRRTLTPVLVVAAAGVGVTASACRASIRAASPELASPDGWSRSRSRRWHSHFSSAC